MIPSSMSWRRKLTQQIKRSSRRRANFRAARAAVRFFRASMAPTIGADPSIGALRNSSNQPYFNKAITNKTQGDFTLPIDLNYEIDL